MEVGFPPSHRAIVCGSASEISNLMTGHSCRSFVTNSPCVRLKGKRFALVTLRGQAQMTTLFAQPDENLLRAEQRRLQQVYPESSLSFTISLNADRRRIFHVLTISEYIETWLHVPGRDQSSPIRVTSDPKGFHVEFLDEKRAPAALMGAYQTYRTSKTNILWRKAGVRKTNVSFVKIRLDGDFERTTLSLTHSGFNSKEDLHWHWQLWKRSLEKLSSLFELQ